MRGEVASDHRQEMMNFREDAGNKGWAILDRSTGRINEIDAVLHDMLGNEHEELVGKSTEGLLASFRPAIDPLDLPFGESYLLERRKDGARFIGMLEEGEEGARFSLYSFGASGKSFSGSELAFFYRYSQDIFIVADPHRSRIQRVNPAFEDLLGYAEEEAQNFDLYGFVHPEDRGELAQHIYRLAEGYPVEGARIRGVTKEGRSLWVEWNAFFDPDEGVLYAIGRKVDEEVRTEQKLQEKGDWYYGLFQNSPVADLLHDGDFLVDLNKEAMRLLEVDNKEQLIGERIEDHYQLLHSKELDKKIREVIQDGSSFYAFETSIRSSNGKMIDLEVDGAPLACDGVDCAYLVMRDVSEKKRSERELKRRETEYRTIVEGIPESIHMVVPMDQEGDRMKVEFVNEEFLRQRGLAREDVIGADLYTFLEERGGEGLYEYYRKAFQEKRIVDYTAELNYGEVDQVYYARAIPILDDQGRCIRLIIMSREVTEEMRIRRELDRLALIARETDNLVIITDPNGLVEWVNDAFIDISGYFLEELRGKKPGDLLQGPGSDPEEVEKMRKAIAEERSEVVELINYNKEGSPYWIRIHLQPIHDQKGSLEGFFSIQTDMTERHLMEERLRRNERRFRVLVENINEGIIRIDAEYNIRFINDRLLEMAGYKREQLQGHNLLELVKQMDPENEERIKEVFESRKEGDKGQNEFEIRSVHGERIPFLVSGTPVFDEEGEFQGSIAIFTNLSERKEMERKVLNAVIQTQESERKRFAQDLHDGIGQILSAAKMQLHSLENASREDLNAHLPELTSMIGNAIDETRTITHDLMPNELQDYGLIQAVEKLLERFGDDMQIRFETPDVELQLSEEFQVACYRIFQELLNNVMKHSQATELTVAIGSDHDGGFSFRVADNGRGFDPKQRKGGRGSINIQRRAELFGGRVEFHSRPGAGTVVEGRIPPQ